MNPKKNSSNNKYGGGFGGGFDGNKYDDKYDKAYEKEFDSFGKNNTFSAGDLKKGEESAGTFENKKFGGEYDDAYEHIPRREEESGWNTDVQPGNPAPTQKGWRGFLQANKRKGPIGAILGLLILGGFGLSFLTPGLLLIHITETITDRLDMQGASLKVRTGKIYAKKLSNQAVSCKVVTIGCKFNTINERQLKSLRASGIDIEVADGTTVTGRFKVKSMSMLIEGEKVDIDPGNLSAAIRKYDRLRLAMDDAYSSDFARFFDAKAKSIFDKIGLVKQPSITGAKTTEEMDEKVKTNANQGRTIDESGEGRYKPVDPNDESKGYTDGSLNEDGSLKTITKEAALDAENNKLPEAKGSLSNLVEEVKGSGKKVGPEALEAAEKGGLTKGQAFGIGAALAVPDFACNLYGMYKAVSLGAKTVRSIQGARYAMDFLSMGNKIKAGDADPKEVEYMANTLTKTVMEKTVDPTTGKTIQTTTKPATDSYGYKYAAYGDTGPLTQSAAEFVNGGGFGGMSGKLSGIANGIVSMFGGKGNIDTVCGVIKSPWTTAAVGLVGFALLFTGPIGWATIAGFATGAVIGAAVTEALTMAQSILTPMFVDMAAGVLIDDTVFGEKSGDALVAGSGYIMSTMAGGGGNAPLSPQDALAYSNVQNQVLAQKAEDERLTLSPFDPSSRYTFMGRIVDQLVPYSAQTTTVSSFANTSYSVFTRSLASIFNPSAFAKEATVDTYTQCDDIDYKALNLATDPFCNPIRGIPPQYLDIDPDTIVNQLILNGDIDETSGAPKSTDYKNFIANCIDRQDPLGYTGDTFDAAKDGHDCFIAGGGEEEKRKAYWYLYQIDLRVIDGMENGFPDVTCLPTTGSNTSTSTPAAGMADAAKIDSIIESEEGGKPGPMHGKGAKIIELSNQYGVNSNFITTIFREETHFGTDGSQGALHNNFGWNKENGDGDCPAISVGGNSYNCYSTADKGIEGALKNITTVSAYKQVPKEAPPGTKAGTVAAVRNVYCPEGDGNCNLENFLKASNDIGLTLQKDDPVFTNASDTTVVNGTTTNATSVAKISSSEINTLITSYGLPAPDPAAANKLQEKLASNPNAGWAAQQMLNGEKTWASKGGNVKLYLNTAWVWSETGADAGPDPYEMNCNNQSDSTPAGATCGSNFQVAGYQAANRSGDYVNVFNKLYPESQLSSVMKDVINNSSKASKDIWKYTSDYSSILDNITINDISPNKSFSDEKTQVLTLILGKDPAMAAALNSFAVSDDDLVAALKKGGCLYGDCSYYNEAWKQNLSNMVLALYQFDGNGPSSGGTACKTSGASQPRGDGKGIAAIFGGTIPGIGQPFGPTDFSVNVHPDWYMYSLQYGFTQPGHTGIDYSAELHSKIYSPVSGTVITAGGTCFFQSSDEAETIDYTKPCPNATTGHLSIPGSGELGIKLDNGDTLILGHMNKIDVKVGDKVTPNQYVGLSGSSNGAHVHVEYRKPDSSTASGERLIDPASVL